MIDNYKITEKTRVIRKGKVMSEKVTGHLGGRAAHLVSLPHTPSTGIQYPNPPLGIHILQSHPIHNVHLRAQRNKNVREKVL